MRGYTLALDFPRRDGVEDLLARLAAISLDQGGRVYLAKDAVLDAASFNRMYPKLGNSAPCSTASTRSAACNRTWRAG